MVSRLREINPSLVTAEQRRNGRVERVSVSTPDGSLTGSVRYDNTGLMPLVEQGASVEVYLEVDPPTDDKRGAYDKVVVAVKSWKKARISAS